VRAGGSDGQNKEFILVKDRKKKRRTAFWEGEDYVGGGDGLKGLGDEGEGNPKTGLSGGQDGTNLDAMDVKARHNHRGGGKKDRLTVPQEIPFKHHSLQSGTQHL